MHKKWEVAVLSAGATLINLDQPRIWGRSEQNASCSLEKSGRKGRKRLRKTTRENMGESDLSSINRR